MVSLATFSGAWLGGCMQSTVPPASISRVPQPATDPLLGSSTPLPNRLEIPTLPHRGPTPSLPTAISNPWKPTAAPREWNSIVIHHTATKRGDVASIHEAHLKKKDKSGNPWLGIGYHFVIGNGDGMGDGEIEPTFRWREQMHGAHAGDEEHNQHGIGVCLVGNFEDAPPSPAQMQAVKRLVNVLKAEYGIPSNKIIGHSDIKATACPGKHFPMAEIAFGTPDTFLGQAGGEHPGAQAAPVQTAAFPAPGSNLVQLSTFRSPLSTTSQEGNRHP